MHDDIFRIISSDFSRAVKDIKPFTVWVLVPVTNKHTLICKFKLFFLVMLDLKKENQYLSSAVANLLCEFTSRCRTHSSNLLSYVTYDNQACSFKRIQTLISYFFQSLFLSRVLSKVSGCNTAGWCLCSALNCKNQMIPFSFSLSLCKPYHCFFVTMFSLV